MKDYLSVIEVLAIHEDQIERYGGAHGVRDLGLLEAALFRPQTGYYADLIEEAAAVCRRKQAHGVRGGLHVFGDKRREAVYRCG